MIRLRGPAAERVRRPKAPPEPLPADIWVLIVSALIVALGYGLIAPVLPQFAESFDVGVTAATIVVSSFAAFRLLFAPAGGRLADAFGERRIYVAGLLIVAGSTAAVAIAQSYWQLLAFRAVGGIGSTMFTVSAMALIIRLAPRGGRARATGYYGSAFLFGNILGPVAGGLMAGLGMRAPFVIYAAGLVLAAAVVWFRLGREEIAAVADGEEPPEGESPPEDSPAGKAQTARPAKVPQESGLPRMRFREAWADSAYRSALGSAVAVGWASMGVRVALYPLFALHVIGAGPELAGIALTVFAAGNAVSVLTLGRLADSYGRRPFILTGLTVLATTTAAIGLSDSLVLFLILTLVAGLGSGMLMPAQQAVVADVIGPDRRGGKVLSRFQMATDTGAILGPVVSGVIVDSAGYGWAFGVTGAVVLLAGLGWVFARETLPADSDADAADDEHGAQRPS